MNCRHPQRTVVGVTVMVLALASCEADQKQLAPCEFVPLMLRVRTADGAATIAEVIAFDGCSVSPSCVPSPVAPCAEVNILGNAAACRLTFVSVDGRKVSAYAAVENSGSPYQCLAGNGQVLTVRNNRFEPSMIDIDFSIALPGDAGAD